MSDSVILVSVENAVKTIAINAPHKKNPIVPAVMTAIKNALSQSLEDGTRAIILTGVGADFSAGADLSDGDVGMMQDVTGYLRRDVNPLIMALRTTNIPIIAKVRGVCVGLGFSMALACDMIFASENALFNQIFARIGLSTDGGGAFFLQQKIGYYKAFELITNAATVSATDALQYGFVNKVFEDSQLDAEVAKIAAKFNQSPFVAIQQIKSNLYEGSVGTLASTLDREAINQGNCFKTSDFVEGVTAFLQKRRANFQGK